MLLVAVLICNCLAGQNKVDVLAILSENYHHTDTIDFVSSNFGSVYRPGQQHTVFSALFRLPIKLYQGLISSQMKPRCYFYPSCSQFSLDAIKEFGLQGFFLGADRIMRCHALSEGKYPLYKETNLLFDPVDDYQLKERGHIQNQKDASVGFDNKQMSGLP